MSIANCNPRIILVLDLLRICSKYKIDTETGKVIDHIRICSNN